MNRAAILLLAAVAALLLAPVHPARAATPTGDGAVQTLANFPALQRLGKADAKTLRRYLNRVAAAYRQAGYDAIADALPKMDEVIALFDEPKGEASDREIRQARTALRHLESALARNPKIALPAKSGESIPNYYGLAKAFAGNANQALKNIAKGKSVAKFLRQKSGSSWITNSGVDQFNFSGTLTPAGSFSVTKSGSGTLTLSGSNTYTGTTMVNGGTLNVNASGTLTLSGNLTFYSFLRRVAFPPGVEIPAELSGGILVNSDLTINGIEVPAGSQIFTVSDSFMVPDGAILIPAPTLTVVGSSTPTPTPTPTPSPTPAE